LKGYLISKNKQEKESDGHKGNKQSPALTVRERKKERDGGGDSTEASEAAGA